MRELAARPAVIRYLGLAGSVALGVDAFLSGAFPKIQLHVDPQSVATGHNCIAIMVLWLGGTAALAGAWWLGRNLVSRDVVPPGSPKILAAKAEIPALLSKLVGGRRQPAAITARWTAITAGLWMLPMLVIPPLSSRDMYAYACQGALFDSGGNPYHQGVSSLPCQWLDSVSAVWRDTPTPYGPIFVAFSGGAARLGSLTAAIIAFRALAVVGVVLMAISLPPIARRFGLPVERVLWIALACPLVIIHLVGGGHNDAITIGLLLAATAVIATRYDRLSGLIIGGILIGLSIGVKPSMLVAVPFITLYAASKTDTSGPLRFPPVQAMVRRGGALLLSAFVALLIPTLITGLGFGWVTALIHSSGTPSWTSPSTAIGTSLNAFANLFGSHPDLIPITRKIGTGLMPIALLLIFWRGRSGNRFYAAGMALLAVTFFAPVAMPWYLIWPLVMFAITPVRARWFAIVVVIASFESMPDGVGLDGLLHLPLSIMTSIAAICGLIAGVRWLRGAEPAEFPPTEFPPEPAATEPARAG
jgi:hypothetical protein